MADSDQYEQMITEADEMMAAKWSSSQAEVDAYNAEQSAADDEQGREVYKKHQTGNMPVPERYDYKDIDTVDELPLNKFREGAQFFAGVDVATGKKQLDSVLDDEPGYQDLLLDQFGEFMQNAADMSGVSAGVRVGGGAVVNMAEAMQNMGIFLAEMAAEQFGPEMDPETAKKFWKERRDSKWMNEMPEAFKAESGMEEFLQETVAYMAPYIGLSRMAGVFQAARAGKLTQAVAADSVVASIMAQGWNPEEGGVATMLRDAGFDNWFLEALDSRQSYENDEKWLSTLQRGAEETLMTAALPLAVGTYALARKNLAKFRRGALKDLMRDMGNGTVTPDGGTRAEPVDKGRRDFLKATAAAAVAPMVGVAGDAAKAAAPAAKAAKAAPVAEAATAVARTGAKTITGKLAEVAVAAHRVANSGGYDFVAKNKEELVQSEATKLHDYLRDWTSVDVPEGHFDGFYGTIADRLGEPGEGQRVVSLHLGGDDATQVLTDAGKESEIDEVMSVLDEAFEMGYGSDEVATINAGDKKFTAYELDMEGYGEGKAIIVGEGNYEDDNFISTATIHYVADVEVEG